MNLKSKGGQFSGRIFTRLYFALVVSIIVIGSSMEYFLSRSDESTHLDYIKNLHQPLLQSWSERLLQSDANQWQAILNYKNSDNDKLNSKYVLIIFSLDDFAADEMTLKKLSGGELLALFDSQDQLTLYQRMGLTQSVLSLEVPYGVLSGEGSGWFSVLFYFLIALVVFFLIRPFANQLLGLKSAAVKFGRGDFSSRLDLPPNTTLAPIAEAFNTMTEKIEHLLLTQRDLVNSVSHELRTPLARLKFGFEIVGSHSIQSVTHKELNQMQKNVSELESLIDEMLCYAEVNQIKTLSPLPVSLRNFIADLVNQIHSKNIDIVVKFDSSISDGEIILCDEKNFNRALANVLRNALGFADTQCRVSVFKSNGYIFIDINDDGPGLGGVEINRIFEPFYKQNNAKRHSGYGLGLAIAQTIVKKQKGSLNVVKGTLKGACFRFALPAS